MKKFTYLAFLGLLSFVSCKKSTIDLDGTTPPPSGSQAVDDFNWMGEAPLSVKVDGSYSHFTEGFAINASGIVTTTTMNSEVEGINITLPGDAKPGEIYSLNSGGEKTLTYFVFAENQTAIEYKSATGKVRVLQNDNAYFAGQFYTTVQRTNPDGIVEQKKLTEGYFRVKKM